MKPTLKFATIAWLTLAVCTACSLLPKTKPSTTLLLPSAADAKAWPEHLAFGHVQASATLQTDRVLVVSGARLLQAEGLRWAAPPHQLLGEHFSRWQASSSNPLRHDLSAARLDVVLDQFAWHDADASVRVAFYGHVQCANGQELVLPMVSATAALASLSDPDQVATAFADAAQQAMNVLTQAASMAKCSE